MEFKQFFRLGRESLVGAFPARLDNVVALVDCGDNFVYLHFCERIDRVIFIADIDQR